MVYENSYPIKQDYSFDLDTLKDSSLLKSMLLSIDKCISVISSDSTLKKSVTEEEKQKILDEISSSGSIAGLQVLELLFSLSILEKNSEMLENYTRLGSANVSLLFDDLSKSLFEFVGKGYRIKDFLLDSIECLKGRGYLSPEASIEVVSEFFSRSIRIYYSEDYDVFR